MRVTMNLTTLSILAPLLLLLLGLGVTVVIDPYIQRQNRRIMLVIVALCLSLIAQNLWENELFVSRSDWELKNILSAYGYSVRPVILILFLYIIEPERKKRLAWTAAGVNAALYFSSPVTKLCFEIRETDFIALRGPLWLSCTLVSGVLMLELLMRTLIRFWETRRLEQLIPVSVALMIAASVAMDMRVIAEPQTVSFLTIAIIVGSVFYYIWLHFQFVRAHEKDLMAAQRIRIMVSQIQPHFLYNTLATIRALCGRDPKKAEEVTEKLGRYLRQNMDSLESEALIPFEKELEHTRIYTEIEMVRFENIRVEYEIEDRDFSLPPLTVQPMVENAIRHGVRIRKEGLVRVSTRSTEDFHEITIRDNGMGFDASELDGAKGSHIGIRNVRERLHTLCGGSLTISSARGEGTTVTIRIPRKEETA